jgi:hypothetical protein
MKKNPETSVNFQIKAVELIESCINPPVNPLAAETVFNFDLNLEHRVNPEDDVLIVVCSVAVFNENREEQLGKLKSGCVYIIKNLKQFLNSETKALELPEPLATALNSVSISTTRGLMFSMFRGTFLHNAVLPVVDPTSFAMQRQ